MILILIRPISTLNKASTVYFKWLQPDSPNPEQATQSKWIESNNALALWFRNNNKNSSKNLYLWQNTHHYNAFEDMIWPCQWLNGISHCTHTEYRQPNEQNPTILLVIVQSAKKEGINEKSKKCFFLLILRFDYFFCTFVFLHSVSPLSCISIYNRNFSYNYQLFYSEYLVKLFVFYI